MRRGSSPPFKNAWTKEEEGSLEPLLGSINSTFPNASSSPQLGGRVPIYVPGDDPQDAATSGNV